MLSQTVTTRRPYAKGDLIAGKYLLESVLDEGGMGAVWAARNVDLDAPVALKLAHFDALNHEGADRLKLEARFEARLEHRAIVRVFDCGRTHTGDPFIAMELLDGKSLAAALETDGPMACSEAIRLLLPIIDGLSAAHDKGIVHRDIKPGNIFLARATRHVQPKILDFGIAKFERRTKSPKITVQGTTLGSPSYMAPEQARGLADVDHRADIWAMCAVLYESISNSVPFPGDNYNSILRSIIEDPVTPLTGDRAQKDLWPILQRGFSKIREHRFQTMRDLGLALARFLVDRGVTDDVCGDSLAATWAEPCEEEVPQFHRRRRPVTLSLLAGAILLGGLAFGAWKANASGASSTADPAVPTRTVENGASNGRVWDGTAPEASASAEPLVRPVLSPSEVGRELASERAESGPGPKAQTSQMPLRSATPRPRPPRGPDPDLKNPY